MCTPVLGHHGAQLPFLGIHDGRVRKGSSAEVLRRHVAQAVCLLISLGALLFLRASWEQPSTFPEHAEFAANASSLPQRQGRLRGLVTRVEKAFKHEADVEVDEVFGNFGLSRESLFGLLDDKALYAAYYDNDFKFMHNLKLAVRAATKANNIVIAKPDTQIVAEELVSSAVLRFTGGINAEYRVMAFNGGGTVDRRGKTGGHKNWSYGGYYERGQGMYVKFYNQSVASGSCTSSGALEDCMHSAGP